MAIENKFFGVARMSKRKRQTKKRIRKRFRSSVLSKPHISQDKFKRPFLVQHLKLGLVFLGQVNEEDRETKPQEIGDIVGLIDVEQQDS